MKFLRMLCLVMLVSCAAVAQDANPSATLPTPVPRLIRFSGQVKDATGTVGITFTLHKSQQDNAALWSETQNVKLDAEGKYTILLGATKAQGVPTELFTTAEAQWLGVRVEGHPEQPRVLLVSVPYALKAAEAETLAGHTATEFVTSDKLATVVQQQLQQTSASLGKKNSAAAKGNAATEGATNFTDTTTNQVVLVTQTGTGSGIIANAVSTYAIQAKSTSGGAIYASGAGNATINAYNTSTTGTAYGLLGSTASTAGVGFRGTATATSGTTYGIMGDSASPSGTGMYGTNSATSGGGVGVYGRASGISGTGVRAVAASATGSTTGLLATVVSPTGTSAVFQNTANGKLISGQAGTSLSEVFAVDSNGVSTGRAYNAIAPAASKPYLVNGYPLLGSDVTNYNLFLGRNTGDALSPSLSDGYGTFDTFVGSQAGVNTTTGSYNVFLGASAGNANTTGRSDTFVGFESGFLNTTGGNNTFLGIDTGYYNDAGTDNTFVGATAGLRNQGGSHNTFIGSQTGARYGYVAGFTAVNFNTFIGAAVGEANAVGDNNIYIATPVAVSESNTIRIGGDMGGGYGDQTATYISGIYSQLNDASSQQLVTVDSVGKLGIAVPSSRRFKDNITPMEDTSKLFQLRPVNFFYKPEYDSSHTKQFGLVAEEVAKVYPELVGYDAEGKPLMVKYQILPAMLLNELQKEHKVVSKQQQLIMAQQKQIATQQQRLANVEKQLSDLRAMVQQLAGKTK